MPSESHSPESPESNGQAKLFAEFPSPTYAEWRQVTEASLKGATIEQRLITKTYEGIDLQPVYRREDIGDLPHLESLPAFPPYTRAGNALGYLTAPWEICQELPASTPEELNRIARADLERGQTALNIVLDQATLAGLDPAEAPQADVGRGGVSIACLADVNKVLAGIDLPKTSFIIQAQTACISTTALFLAALRQKGLPTAQIKGAIAIDPLGSLVRKGTLSRPLAKVYDSIAQLALWAKENAPKLQTLTVHSQPYHNGGANAVQELAFALATGVEYLREMQQRGISIDDAAQQMRFSFALGSKFFMEIAKLRAARLLWAKIVQAFGGSVAAQKMTLHARTALWNKTVYDPYVNLLRTTTEAFSAVMGGCNSLHVGGFDEVIRVPDDFSRRIARNIQVILQKECHFERVVDPAGGSWYVEKLTDSLGHKAWELFQEVERQGGMLKALEAGFPQAQIAKTAADRAANLAKRKDIFVGTNMYPNLTEKPLEVHIPDYAAIQKTRIADLAAHQASVDQAKHAAAIEKLKSGAANLIEAAIEAVEAGATLGEITKIVRTGAGEKPTIQPIVAQRGSEGFEALRSACQAQLAQTGSRPKVFLANMGPIPQHKGRAEFATGFFGVGGFEVVSNDGFATPEEAASAAIASGAAIVVICSTDATYPELVPPLTKLLKTANPTVNIVLAGYPPDQIEAHRAAGVDEFIHIRSDVYATLQQLLQKTGVLA